MLRDKRVVLGVSGGIAAYKVADLASKLAQAGALVDVIMTQGAQQFVTPLTFQALTKRPVRTDIYADWLGEDTGHVGLARNADILVVAPATAHTIARLALGLSDDMLCAVYLSTQAPVLVIPAMESGMFLHPATQEHLETLRRRGATVMQPGEGHLASGASGVGRLPEVPEMLAAIKRTLGRDGPLAGRKVVVTAGGTQEPLDPVRFIGNGSSGRMGYAIAEEALNAGAQVTLITGAASAQPPHGVELVRARTTREMEAAVREAVRDADVLVMAAAVADFAPRHTSEQKIKKTDAGLTVELERNPDILAGLATMDLPNLLRVGFAAETEDLLDNARAKLQKKKLDLIIANDAVASIGTESSSITFVRKDGNTQQLPHLPKEASARAIIEEIAHLILERDS
ncbi:MAG TPA: bifunctional phosphopantothenoylcysteine decarboxylase/phosphopantothenate--cysteine ligase CoaBC, partial [Chloroflexia bacterium]|nr:bifunctional phosphopantothenoylcysteine decarboxylase/phosphopantothenate--cysteine ligase CoaBC [Chloroflexia bacterium]